jgi:hypothetical protein
MGCVTSNIDPGRILVPGGMYSTVVYGVVTRWAIMDQFYGFQVEVTDLREAIVDRQWPVIEISYHI